MNAYAGPLSATTEEIELVCSYIREDRTVAQYFGTPIERVAWIRRQMKERRIGPTGYVHPTDGTGLETERMAEADAIGGSQILNDRIQRLFRKWERKHGFQEGAAKVLLPAGYRPEREAA
jgi:hypothetical protein